MKISKHGFFFLIFVIFWKSLGILLSLAAGILNKPSGAYDLWREAIEKLYENSSKMIKANE